jgi:hypothetical protein
MMRLFMLMVVSASVFAMNANRCRGTEQTYPVQVTSVRKIVSDGRHNAFAGFVMWKGDYWLGFRKASGHTERDGDIYILRSKDRRKWDESLQIEVAQDDRDPQFLPTVDRMFVYINSLFEERLFTAAVVWTNDGTTWSKPQQVYEPGYILWKPIEYHGKFYAAAHRPGPISHRHSHLVTSEDGINWNKVSTIREAQGESETTLHFGESGVLTAFLRSQKTVDGAILESKRPYNQWTERSAGVHLSGQSAYTFDGVTYVLSRLLQFDPPFPPGTLRVKEAGRKLDQATIIYTYDRHAEQPLKPYCLLGPLDGNHDSSYPTVVRDGNHMLVVFHRAAHPYEGSFRFQDAADLFMARVPLKGQE